MSVIEHFKDEINNRSTSFFILDSAGAGKHGDVEFKQHYWSIKKYKGLSEGDLFIYRRPDTKSELKEFYLFGAGKIGPITGDSWVHAEILKPYIFEKKITKSDLSRFEWEFKTRGENWRDFFWQYGINKITKNDFLNLLRLKPV